MIRSHHLTEEEIKSIKTNRQTFISWGRTKEALLNKIIQKIAVEFDLKLRVERIRKLGYAFIVTNEEIE